MRGAVVVITGGSSGIGLATARRFASLGARVWLIARNEAKLASAVASLGGDVRPFAADVTDRDRLRELAAHVAEGEGRVDVLVNSAGQLELGSAEESAAVMAERLMRVNYLGVAWTVAALLPLLRAGRRPSIVNLSSFAGRAAPHNWSAYAASKHALQAYSNSLRQELGRDRIHVGIVMPGPIRSPMTDDLLYTENYPIPPGLPVLTVEPVAAAIVRCVRRRRAEVTVPGYFGPLLRIAAAFPRAVDLLYRPYRRA